MANLITIVPKTDYTLTPVGTTTASTIIARHVNVVPYRELVLVARVHSKSATAVVQTLSVTVVNTAPSDDDPSTDFASTTALAQIDFGMGSTYSAPQVNFASVTAPWGPFVRIILNYRQATQNSTFTGSVSVDLVGRE